MNKILGLLSVVFLLSLILGSCNKEPLSVGDAIELGEFKDKNVIQLKENTMLLDDPESYVEMTNGSITLKGPMSNYDSIKIGSIITKLTYHGGEDFTYFRKVINKFELNSHTVLETEDVGLTDVFDRFYFDSKNRNNETIVFRNNIFSSGFSLSPINSIYIQELKGTIDPDIDFTFEYDTLRSEIIIALDQYLGLAPYITFSIKDCQLTVRQQLCYSGQLTAGYKNDKIIQGNFIPAIAAYGPLALYFNPKIEALLKIKGSVCFPDVTLTTPKFDYEVTLNAITPGIYWPQASIQSNTAQVVVGDFEIGGKISLEGLVGGDLYVSNFGSREIQLLKAGVTLGGYSVVSASSKSKLPSLVNTTKVKGFIGLGAKAFVSAELFGADYVPGLKKAGFFFETPVFPIPVYSFDSEYVVPCEKNITDVTFNQNNGLLNFRVNCTDCSSSKYYFSFNDSTLFTDTIPTEFNYNQDYSIPTPSFFLVSNIAAFQDKNSPSCYFEADFRDPNLGHDNCDLFIDTRDNFEYCTVTIGDQTWLSENLRHNVQGSVWYDNVPNDETFYFGKLYTYDAVLNGQSAGGGQIRGICPPGTHLPSLAEFATLVADSGGVGLAGKNLKYPSPSFWENADLPAIGTFNAVGAGEYYSWKTYPNQFGHKGQQTFFWTSSTSAVSDTSEEVKPVLFKISGSLSGSDILYGGHIEHHWTTIPNLGVSCRCILD